MASSQNELQRRRLYVSSEFIAHPTSPTLDQDLEPNYDSSASSITFRKIGAGACGSVFAQDGKSLAIKLAKPLDHTELWNDYQMHEEIARGFHRYIIDEVRVPGCYFFVPSDRESFWDKHPELLDAARDLLIEKHCAPRIKDKVRADFANRDCLVRVYLGSTQGKIGGMFFSLRNFKLHLNHMMDLELDTEALAPKTDARDVEFVLGSSTRKTTAAKPISAKDLKPYTYTGPPTDEIEDFFCRVTELFVLDFNQVRTITMDGEGVAMAVEAWRLNDPYYPKPLPQTPAERHVWKAFVISYLTASHEVMGLEGCQGMVLALPRKFILGITEVERVETLSRKAQGTMLECIS
ncbi:hypothetical protein B0T26DRAFT_813168 [Lasiosphaeria miniovina]|uniref:DUF3669 domain-containing protein n=1 Tax=Lasiosphaeria miniovina TaxID=1954250 RepID=A0AA40DRJ4_9PEZI|nr:uncharacterized protein B0T26DRAFT_813168 [Lasiosphaeria miniovina]KAK0712940.1 hypothetical protein B0T26DRAFT_813168 [Lasiosphaeria miniovina]